MAATLSIIAAIGRNRELGKRGGEKLLWYIPEDFAHFKSITMGHPVIMGQSTYASIGGALPGRLNIVLSQDPQYRAPGCTVATSIEEALAYAKEDDQEEVFFIGGGYVYAQALPLAKRLYLTCIDADFPEADVFFPEFTDFRVVAERASANEQFSYKFVTLERNGYSKDD